MPQLPSQPHFVVFIASRSVIVIELDLTPHDLLNLRPQRLLYLWPRAFLFNFGSLRNNLVARIA